jgi:REP element-mobilizing transposase RayT
MPRALRVEFPGALYHVASRGNNRARIFWTQLDRERFVQGLAETVARDGFEVYAYCLLGNHYHALVATPLGNLARGMQRLNSAYAQHVNKHHGRSGHVFQGRYHARLIERDAHLLELSRYVVLNPVRAGLVTSPEAWRWSSYRATAGIEPSPGFLSTAWLLGRFGTDDRRARGLYAAFVADGLGRPDAVLAPAA